MIKLSLLMIIGMINAIVSYSAINVDVVPGTGMSFLTGPNVSTGYLSFHSQNAVEEIRIIRTDPNEVLPKTFVGNHEMKTVADLSSPAPSSTSFAMEYVFPDNAPLIFDFDGSETSKKVSGSLGQYYPFSKQWPEGRGQGYMYFIEPGDVSRVGVESVLGVEVSMPSNTPDSTGYITTYVAFQGSGLSEVKAASHIKYSIITIPSVSDPGDINFGMVGDSGSKVAYSSSPFEIRNINGNKNFTFNMTDTVYLKNPGTSVTIPVKLMLLKDSINGPIIKNNFTTSSDMDVYVQANMSGMNVSVEGIYQADVVVNISVN